MRLSRSSTLTHLFLSLRRPSAITQRPSARRLVHSTQTLVLPWAPNKRLEPTRGMIRGMTASFFTPRGSRASR